MLKTTHTFNNILSGWQSRHVVKAYQPYGQSPRHHHQLSDDNHDCGLP